MVLIETIGLSSHINFYMVFAEGVFSFFSPCVIPLIPLYMGYLAGNAKTVDENNNIKYERKTVLFYTLLFVLGISTSFFILGLGFSTLGVFFKQYRDIISKIGGIIIVLLGLKQVGILKIPFLDREVRLNKKASIKKINPITAYIMGFLFSFAWTPCVGPILASVLILASNANSLLEGNLLVLLYALGFVIPFLFLGLFTGETLNFIKNNKNITKIIVKIGGIILVIIGLMLIFGSFDKLQFSSKDNKNSVQDEEFLDKKDESENKNKEDNSYSEDDEQDSKNEKQKLIPIKLENQFGNIINVGDFKGKVVFINFFATWCPPCRQEIPDIEKLYEDNGYNKKDVIVLGVVSPNIGKERDIDYINDFIKEYNIKYPVLMDKDGKIFSQYGVYSMPTTFIIDKESNIYGYITGAIPRNIMDKSIADAKNSTK